jgi:hypothetical protein
MINQFFELTGVFLIFLLPQFTIFLNLLLALLLLLNKSNNFQKIQKYKLTIIFGFLSNIIFIYLSWKMLTSEHSTELERNISLFAGIFSYIPLVIHFFILKIKDKLL